MYNHDHIHIFTEEHVERGTAGVGCKFLTNDIPNMPFNDFVLYPRWIVAKDYSLVPVYIGLPARVNNLEYMVQDLLKMGAYGIYIKEEDYDKVHHDCGYIFFHEIENDRFYINKEKIDQFWAETGAN